MGCTGSGYKPRNYPNNRSVVYFTEQIPVVFFRVKQIKKNQKPVAKYIGWVSKGSTG